MHQSHRQMVYGRRGWWRGTLMLVLMALGTAPRLKAHEIPQRVAIRMFVHREANTLHVLVRVPLEAMRDLDFPLRDDGSLDLLKVRPLLADAAQQWVVPGLTLRANGSELAAPRIVGAKLSLPNDRSFEQWESARASFLRPPPEHEIIPWQQPHFDVALEYAVTAPMSDLELLPTLATLGIRTSSIVHIGSGQGDDRMLVYEGNPEAIALDPAWLTTVAQFARRGVRHILGGIDHVLFLLCLLLPVRRWQSLVLLVTAFTAAHSLTLGVSALGLAPSGLWFPPFIEVLIAASIVWLAIENVVLPSARLSERWVVAFCFGLIHGFGFAFALRQDLQFAGTNLLGALAGFNVGVETGQLLVLAAGVPLLWLAHRYAGAGRERILIITGSVLVAHSAWHWLTERAEALWPYRSQLAWPSWDAGLALSALRILLLCALAVAVGLAVRQIPRVPRRS
jgi:hypothetical protein